MNRSVTIAQQPEVSADELDEITEVELECGWPRHRGRVPVVARRRLRSRG